MKRVNQIVILILILNIVLFIYLAFFLKPVEVNTLEEYAMQQSNGIALNEVNENTETPSVYFNNIDELNNSYTGELGIYNLTRKITSLIEEGFKDIYTQTVNMTDKQVSNYFEENKEIITLNTGITDVNNFIKLVNNLQIYKNGTMQYESSKLVTGTLASDDKYTTFQLQISYTDNSVLNFKVYFSNKDNIDTPIIIIEPM